MPRLTLVPIILSILTVYVCRRILVSILPGKIAHLSVVRLNLPVRRLDEGARNHLDNPKDFSAEVLFG